MCYFCICFANFVSASIVLIICLQFVPICVEFASLCVDFVCAVNFYVIFCLFSCSFWFYFLIYYVYLHFAAVYGFVLLSGINFSLFLGHDVSTCMMLFNKTLNQISDLSDNKIYFQKSAVGHLVKSTLF